VGADRGRGRVPLLGGGLVLRPGWPAASDRQGPDVGDGLDAEPAPQPRRRALRLSAWQGHPRTDEGERQFFKATYQGIVAHPDDEHVVATGIDLLSWVVRDYPHRLSLARFGYERYFRHERRIDNCANCMVGDTTQALARNLSTLYTEAGRFDEAIAVSRRLLDERSRDVSPYLLAETWSQLAWAHWRKGERERARQIVREGLERYGDTVRGDDLRQALAAFEREEAAAPR
jgi:tetratricopeptide (TPR) repeat protein